MNIKRDKKIFLLSCICLVISSLSLLGVAKGSFNEFDGSRAIAFAVALTFWIGLILGYILLCVVNSHRKKYEAGKKNRRKTTGCGLIRFFSNGAAMVVDSILIITLVLFILFRVLSNISIYFDLTVIALLICSIHLHGLFNGKNFRYINQNEDKSVDDKAEKKSDSKSDKKSDKSNDKEVSKKDNDDDFLNLDFDFDFDSKKDSNDKDVDDDLDDESDV
ncbi:MAG: hypothetical protein ACI4II_04640 [Acutalibacteraceae bacterium]